MRPLVLLVLPMSLALAACGESSPAPITPPPPSAVSSGVPTEAPSPAAAGPSLDEVRARSSCAFESLDALCEGLRENFASSEQAWASDDCARGPRRTSSGPFAEALLVGIRNGYERATGAPRADHALLGGAVHEPAGREGSTQILLVARVGSAWFPIVLFEPMQNDAAIDGLEWSLASDGLTLEWTDAQGSAQGEEPSSYGNVERSIAVVDRGVPILAAEAAVEVWRGDVDLACTRACNGAPSPPPYPGCEQRCASRARATRTWTRTGTTLEIGATRIERTGAHADAIEMETAAAQTLHLDAADPAMLFCAFQPVEHATPLAAPRTDADSLAARERAHALIASGAFHEVPGAIAAAQPGASRSIVAIDQQLGGGCGGGGCTLGLDYRTVEGTMPERGLTYFEQERGVRVGCDDAALPEPGAGGPTLVEVAPAISREAIGCGFTGWDGAHERHWVIVRVLGAAP